MLRSFAHLAATLSVATLIAASFTGCASTPSADDTGTTGDHLDCGPVGTWAIRASTPVKWGATALVTAGQGQVVTYLRSVRVLQPPQVVDAAKVCAIEMPSLVATPAFRSESYALEFPATVFDAPSMPEFTIVSTVTGSGPGATFAAPASAALIGASMPNPLTDVWPASGTALATVDADGDGNVGFTGVSTSGAGVTALPLAPGTNPARAKQVFVAFRQVLSVRGAATGCGRSEGTGEIAVIGGQPALDAHIVGCQRADGTRCAPSEVALLDAGLPRFVPTAPTVTSAVKIEDTTKCADARNASF